MLRFVKIVSAGFIVSGVFGGIALTSSPAEAKVTKEERALLRKTVAECKADAKEKRLKWRERRKWVRSCVTVKLEKPDPLKPVLKFQIDAYLRTEDPAEPVLFDVTLHRDSRRIAVSGASS